MKGRSLANLSSVSNLGGTFPRFFILKLVDYLSVATCHPSTSKEPFVAPGSSLVTSPFSCVLEADKKRCEAGGGTCDTVRDGYYITNVICVIIGIATFLTFIRPAVQRLQALPLRAWRLHPGTAKR